MLVQPKLKGELYFVEALKIMYPKLAIKNSTKNMRFVVNTIEKSANPLRFDYKIKEIHSGHIRDLLDNLIVTNNRLKKRSRVVL